MSPRDVTGKYAVRNYGEECIEWNYDRNVGDNLGHKSIQQTKFLTPMYKNTG
jgi:hypothetical protein